eukprot:CAMPEP_0182451794 /NCGR_PEP_ID=MMETSP1172-20130603/43913_1 /TAXON_ID=708627 /ORGANISM="Timspurckia oligopyrenoides, Strain CCMP3278" /LENGTH=366 /DNA_ID=CAMNT_0024649599 /DNA_START=20 /DNA_END=1121 /DNA_ORIENTATION=-
MTVVLKRTMKREVQKASVELSLDAAVGVRLNKKERDEDWIVKENEGEQEDEEVEEGDKKESKKNKKYLSNDEKMENESEEEDDDDGSESSVLDEDSANEEENQTEENEVVLTEAEYSEIESDYEGEVQKNTTRTSKTKKTKKNVNQQENNEMAFFDELEKRWIQIHVAVPTLAEHSILMPDIIQNAAKNTIIREIHGLSRSFVEKDDQSPSQLRVTTEGANLHAAWMFSDCILDMNRIRTNDVYLTLETYGVEAARLLLIMELTQVFDAYGIPVDKRHLSLIADYMMVNGSYRALNRIGMLQAPSAFQRMSFETSVKFLTNAALGTDSDYLHSPSAAICLGELPKIGTGIVSLYPRIDHAFQSANK